MFERLSHRPKAAVSTTRPGRRLSLGAFRRQTAGSVAVEFAFVGAAMIPMIIEIMQAGFYFYTSAAIDRATDGAARAIMTGTVTNANTSQAQFLNSTLCPLLPAGLSCASVVVNVQTVSEDVQPNGFYTLLNAAGTALAVPSMDNSKTTFCTGTDGSYVAVQVFYAMPVFSPVWTFVNSVTWNGSTVRWVQTTRAFKNEPFQATGSGSC